MRPLHSPFCSPFFLCFVFVFYHFTCCFVVFFSSFCCHFLPQELPKLFPGALELSLFFQRLQKFLSSVHFVDVYPMIAMCRDEICSSFCSAVERRFGKAFRIGSLAGLVLCGPSGFASGKRAIVPLSFSLIPVLVLAVWLACSVQSCSHYPRSETFARLLWSAYRHFRREKLVCVSFPCFYMSFVLCLFPSPLFLLL